MQSTAVASRQLAQPALTGGAAASAAAAVPECQPGLALNGTASAGWCVACTQGKYCPGGAGDSSDYGAELDCPSGLESKFAGSKSQAQCFTKAGFGRKSVRGTNGVITYEGVQCDVATYNVGGNTAGCQKCGAGLTTATAGSSASTACREYTVLEYTASSAAAVVLACHMCARVTYMGLYHAHCCAAQRPQAPWHLTLLVLPLPLLPCCDLPAVAPAGSYLDKGVGKKCPKGTYTDSLNSKAVCDACATGVTTAGEGSTGVSACSRAIKGYKYTGANTAAKCDINTYNDAETTAANCTDCPNGELPCCLPQ